jgi:hypothetical protein
MLAYTVLLMNDPLPTLSVAPDYGDDEDRGSKDVSRDRESREFRRWRAANTQAPRRAEMPGLSRMNL